MQKNRLHKLSAAIAVALTLAIAFTAFVSATGKAAPVAQGVRAQEVRGVLTGGQFAQIWLGLVPEVSGAQVTVIAEWDRSNPASSGLNFFLLDEQGVRRVGEEPMSSIALGAGNPDFDVNAPDNTVGASFNANGFGPYTIVVSNESSQDASFTLRVTNGFILDDSNQVTDPSSPVTTTQTTETTVVTETTTTTVAATATPVAATAAVTTTTASTATVAATATPAATTAPAAVTGTPGVVRTLELSGELPVQDAQHFLGLQPDGNDVEMTLRLTFDPQDNSELARRLNFWVLTQAGFQQVIGGANPSDVAIAAGNRVFRGQNNERVASFRSSGTGAFTVIVYNNATVPGTYTLGVEGGLLIDDAGQTNEGKAAGSTAITTTGNLTTTVTTTVTTTTAAPAASTATTTTVATAATGRTGEPGGSYTVKSGDTLALIARDIYGNVQLYEQLCSFNSITNCNVIEVGDVINLPTTAQLNSGATAPAAPAATATPATPATPTTTSAPAATATVTATTPVTATTGVTPTTATTGTTTGGSTTTGSTTAGSTATAASQSIYAVLAANSNYSSLVRALDKAGLSSALDGSGEYTIFAPTNAAFTALRTRFNLSEAQFLALPELADTLRFHVLSGVTPVESLTDGEQAATLQGKDVNFEVDGSTAKVNGANIVANDIAASNGMIHVIDAVIIPPAE